MTSNTHISPHVTQNIKKLWRFTYRKWKRLKSGVFFNFLLVWNFVLLLPRLYNGRYEMPTGTEYKYVYTKPHSKINQKLMNRQSSQSSHLVCGIISFQKVLRAKLVESENLDFCITFEQWYFRCLLRIWITSFVLEYILLWVAYRIAYSICCEILQEL